MVLGLLAWTVALSGCARLGTVLTGVEISSEVEISSGAPIALGETFPAPNPLRGRKRYPYDLPAYRDRGIEWSVHVFAHGAIRVDLFNRMGEDLNLRWDLARMRSSELQEFHPLLVSGFSSGTLEGRQTYVNDASGIARHRPPQTVLASNQTENPLLIVLKIDGRSWFPNAPDSGLFGVRPHREGFGFIDEGIGRWIELELPVEAGEHVWRYRVRLTLERAHQWVSYF